MYFDNVIPLTNIDGFNLQISLDGKWLIFQSSFLTWYHDHYNQIYLLNLEEPRKRKHLKRLSPGIGESVQPSFYPDSQHFFFLRITIHQNCRKIYL
uniref:Dipeptidylpeptidase IV N-terminal domain-containing protein n=1 Tax=Ditylenchus dipsaci TaxID=166011 RepID=A0A915E0C3_9BILA